VIVGKFIVLVAEIYIARNVYKEPIKNTSIHPEVKKRRVSKTKGTTTD
jgi:hypothetical protein